MAAGFSRADIEFTLHHDADVVSVESIDGATALWRISVAVEGRPPVEILLDNGINDTYVQALIPLDVDHLVEALSSIGPYATVGLAFVDNAPFMRSALFIEHSTVHALTNTYRAMALAYLAYQQALSP